MKRLLRTNSSIASEWLADILAHESAAAYVVLILFTLGALSFMAYFALFPRIADLVFIEPLRDGAELLLKLLPRC